MPGRHSIQLGARAAWGGQRNEFATLAVMPAGALGKPARLRFRLGSSGTGDSRPGWCLGGLHVAGS